MPSCERIYQISLPFSAEINGLVVQAGIIYIEQCLAPHLLEIFICNCFHTYGLLSTQSTLPKNRGTVAETEALTTRTPSNSRRVKGNSSELSSSQTPLENSSLQPRITNLCLPRSPPGLNNLHARLECPESQPTLQHGMAWQGSGDGANPGDPLDDSGFNSGQPRNDSGYNSGGPLPPPPQPHYFPYYANSHRDLDILGRNSQDLEQCGFYFGSIDSDTSKKLLRHEAVGTFLLRDSKNSQYLYSLSVKTENGATSVRILYSNGLFQFDSDERVRKKLPRFESILGLIDFHAMATREGGNKSWQWEDSTGKRHMKLALKQPLMCSVPSLAHLARVAINQCIGNVYLTHVVDQLPKIDCRLKDFMKEYPYRI